MKELENICESVTLNAIYVNINEIDPILKSFKNKLCNMPRIPNILYKTKSYDMFEIKNWKNNFKTIAILIKDFSHEDAQKLNISLINLNLNANYFTYKEILEKIIPKDCSIGSFETIGNIIHLNLNEKQIPYKDIIGKVLHFKTGMTVINKLGQIEETFRFYQLEILAGDDCLETIHVENGVKIFIDLFKVYWCSRLQTERLKIAQGLKKGEILCDPFCGAGPQVLLALKYNAKVYANDLNEFAIKCLKKSLKLNKKECLKVENMDADTFLKSLENTRVDSFVFNLPNYSLDYIPLILNRKDFKLHCFFFCKAFEDPVTLIKDKTGLLVEKKWLREVRKVSPSKSVWKLEIDDIELKRHQNFD